MHSQERLSLNQKYIDDVKKSSEERAIPNITKENAAFLQKLIQERKPKHILEIGTANGYSSLQFSIALDRLYRETHSDITTIEQDWSKHTEAVEHFHAISHTNIHAIWGNAKQVIPLLADEYFDFIFIDGMKREYLNYFLLCLPKMHSDALIIFDDVEKFRNKMEDLFKFLEEKKIPLRFEKTDPDDSILLLERKDIFL